MNEGGAETRVLDLMRHLDPMRYQFEFCCLSGLPGKFDNEIRLLGGKVHLLRLDLSFPIKFRRLLRTGSFDAVQSHVHWPSGYILRLAAKADIPQRICQFATTYDGVPPHPVRQVRNFILKHWVRRYATDLLGVSEAALESNLGVDWRVDPRCRVLYRGIDLSNYTIPSERPGVRHEFGIPPDATLVIHVGRMDPSKNHTRLLQIFEQFLETVPNSYLLLAGAKRSPVADSIREYLRKPGLKSHVIVAGVRSDIPRLLRASDIMIFPSCWEGLPGAVVEALAAGIPVVATDLPGIQEIAQYLPNLITMSLQHPDKEWASAAHNLLDRPDEEDCLNQRFLDSPFCMTTSIAASERLYLSGRSFA